MMCQEIIKFMKNKNTYKTVGCMGIIVYAGNSTNYYFLDNNKIGKVTWILDIRATSHMCYDLSLFTDVTTPYHPISISLLDGSTLPVKHIGIVVLNPRLILKGVLHIPNFKHNLLSIRKITQTSNIFVKFLSDSCVLQDLVTYEMGFAN